MLGWLDAEALAATVTTGLVHFHSRSRGRLWRKGETSGHELRLRDLSLDCDGDALLLTVDAVGPTCHTGARSCFDAGLGASLRCRTPCLPTTPAPAETPPAGLRLARDAVGDDPGSRGEPTRRLLHHAPGRRGRGCGRPQGRGGGHRGPDGREGRRHGPAARRGPDGVACCPVGRAGRPRRTTPSCCAPSGPWLRPMSSPCCASAGGRGARLGFGPRLGCRRAWSGQASSLVQVGDHPGQDDGIRQGTPALECHRPIGLGDERGQRQGHQERAPDEHLEGQDMRCAVAVEERQDGQDGSAREQRRPMARVSPSSGDRPKAAATRTTFMPHAARRRSTARPIESAVS